MTINTSTDCRSEEGMTVGILDAVIVLARLLRGRSLDSDAVREALRDLAADEDVRALYTASWRSLPVPPPPPPPPQPPGYRLWGKI